MTMHLPSRLVLAGLISVLSVANSSARTQVELSLGADFIGTNNFYYQERGEKETVAGLRARPAIALIRQGTLLTSRFVGSVESAHFNASPEDNYADAAAALDGTFRLGINEVSANAYFHSFHDPFGSTRTEGSALFDRDLDKWQKTGLTLDWTRKGQVRGDIFSNVTAGFSDKQYTTNKTDTAYLNRQSSFIGGLVGVKLTAKTGLFVSSRYERTEFDQEINATKRSGETTAFFGGIRWDATARTEGDIQMGLASRDNDGYDTRFWKATVRWEPRHTHLVTLSTGRQFDASYRADTQFFDSRTIDLSWAHHISRRLSSRIEANLRRRNFVGSTFEDDSQHYTARLKYELANGVSIFGQLRHSDRDADQQNYSYEADSIQLGFDSQLN